MHPLQGHLGFGQRWIRWIQVRQVGVCHERSGSAIRRCRAVATVATVDQQRLHVARQSATARAAPGAARSALVRASSSSGAAAGRPACHTATTSGLRGTATRTRWIVTADPILQGGDLRRRGRGPRRRRHWRLLVLYSLQSCLGLRDRAVNEIRSGQIGVRHERSRRAACRRRPVAAGAVLDEKCLHVTGQPGTRSPASAARGGLA